MKAIINIRNHPEFKSYITKWKTYIENDSHIAHRDYEQHRVDANKYIRQAFMICPCCAGHAMEDWKRHEKTYSYWMDNLYSIDLSECYDEEFLEIITTAKDTFNTADGNNLLLWRLLAIHRGKAAYSYYRLNHSERVAKRARERAESHAKGEAAKKRPIKCRLFLGTSSHEADDVNLITTIRNP